MSGEKCDAKFLGEDVSGRGSIQITCCFTTTSGGSKRKKNLWGDTVKKTLTIFDSCDFLRYYKKALQPKNYGVETVEELAGLVSDTVVICPPKAPGLAMLQIQIFHDLLLTS